MHWTRKWQCQKIAEEIVGILKDKGYNALYAEDAEEAKKKVLEIVPEGASIAMGGSITLGDMGLVDIFRSDKYRFYDRYATKSYEETYKVYRESMMADWLVTGTNAITREGEIVTTDSSGNRAGGIIFGPDKVLIVAGANKVVDDLPAAFRRIKEIAPMNAKRIGHKTPCAESGRCENCDTPWSVCNATSIIHNGRKHPGRYNIIIVAEDLGY